MVQKNCKLIKKHKTLSINYKKRNPMAQEVRTPKYKPRVVKAKKGKGSYKRQKSI